MGSKKKEQEFTVQGLDPPVPVGEGGERMGHPRPSSDDRPAHSVIHQAEVQANTTDRHVAGDPFRRSKKVGRSPVRPVRSISTSSCRGSDRAFKDIIILDDPLEGRYKAKRKREEETKVVRKKEDRGPGIVEKLIEEFVTEIAKLQTLVGEQINTHKKIKEQTHRLGRMAEYAQSEKISDWFKENDRKTITPKTATIGCQTTPSGKVMKEEVAVDEGKINNVRTFEDFNKIKDNKWPANLYRRAFIARGSPLKTKSTTDLLLTIEEGSEQEGLTKAFLARFPELKELEGKLATMAVNTRVIGAEEPEGIKERYIFRAEVSGDASDWYDTLSKIKEIMIRAGRNEIAIFPPRKDQKGEVTRKMLKCIFRHEEIKCLVFTAATKEKGEEKMGRNRTGKDKNPEMKAIIVKESGKTYTQALRSLKEKVHPTSRAAQAIRRVRETKDGRMLILVDKNDGGAAEELKQLIHREGRNINITEGRKKEVTLYIRDIDGLVEKHEVTQAINMETGGDESTYRTSELRPYFGGNQAITVWIEEKKAKLLIEKRTIRIGLSMCNISEKVEVKRCYKCWQYGHLRAECKDDRDLSQACRRCGNPEHKEKDRKQNKTELLHTMQAIWA